MEISLQDTNDGKSKFCIYQSSSLINSICISFSKNESLRIALS